VVGLILAGAVVATAVTYLPASTSPGAQNTVLRVGYPDSLDESDVSDLYAYNNILPAEGITVAPTFYDAPYLSYQGLAGGQQDIALVSGSSLFAGVSQGEQSTLVSCYSLGGTFLMIAGYGITNPSQLKGGAVDDFGTGSQTRALNLYWLSQAGVPTNTVGLNSSSVYLRPSGPNPTRLSDLEKGIGGVKAITVDDFLLPSVEGANNNTANNGPFNVLFYSPTNVPGVCYAVQDSWLASARNQAALTKWIAAIIQAQRDFISNPSLMQNYAASQLPLTASSEISFASTFYPQHWTYWPYGILNLQGTLSATNLLANSNTFYVTSGSITSPLTNSSGGPFGLFNGNFEKAALQSLGSYTYPCQSWVTPSFAAQANAIVPSSLGSVPANCSKGTSAVSGPSAQTLLAVPLFAVPRLATKRSSGF
jgi:hypothetical protein